MTAVTPSAHDPPRSVFASNPLAMRDASKKDLPTTDLYVSQIPCDVDISALRDLFSRFGPLQRVYEGRKDQSARMKWAFISFVRPDDAQYVLQKVAKVGISGSILNIRPRDKDSIERERRQFNRQDITRPGRSETTRSDRTGADISRIGPDIPCRTRMQMQKPFLRRQISPRQMPQMDTMRPQDWDPYPLLSKTLRVANLPPEYTPKNLFDLFSEIGEADGAFIYAFPDAAGKRVGEVAMATYLFAQRALEHMDGHYIEGYALEVTYKPASPSGHQGPFHVPPEPIVEYSTALWSAQSSPIHTLPSMNNVSLPMGNTPLPNTTLAMPHNIFMSPISPPQMAMWPFPTSPVATPPLAPTTTDGIPTSPPMTAPEPTIAPEPSPPPPYSALPPIPESEDHLIGADAFYRPAPHDPCNLFIKNLDDEIVANQADLEALFSEFGTITSAFLATYAAKDASHPPVSKGFGFVAFSRPEDADLARYHDTPASYGSFTPSDFRTKMHGAMLGNKKLFVSFAERKADRQIRLKALFESMDKLALELRSEVAIKPDQSRPVKPIMSGYRRGGFRRGRRIRRGQLGPGRRIPSEPYMDRSFVDIDFHDDFPPLPKSIKPNQSPTLQKLTESLAAQAHQKAAKVHQDFTVVHQNFVEAHLRSFAEARSPQAESASLQPQARPLHPERQSPILKAGAPEIDPVADLVMLPRAPPPSSEEISTAGNTAPSTPTPKYTRPPRMTPQSLHDQLLFANATLTTLQESPLLRPAAALALVAGDDLISLDTTAGTIPAEAAIKEEWVAPFVSGS